MQKRYQEFLFNSFPVDYELSSVYPSINEHAVFSYRDLTFVSQD